MTFSANSSDSLPSFPLRGYILVVSKGIFLYIRKRELYGPLLREQLLRSLPFLCFNLSSGSERDGNADLDASYPMIKKRVSLER